MHADILTYLNTQRIGVIALEMPDGSPHASTVHFAHVGDMPVFIFETDRRYKKSEALHVRPISRASLVIGFEESKKSCTLQIDGEARIIGADEQEKIDAYLSKFPEKSAKAQGENVIFFELKPTWWRFTVFGRVEGMTVYLSDGTVKVGK